MERVIDFVVTVPVPDEASGWLRLRQGDGGDVAGGGVGADERTGDGVSVDDGGVHGHAFG